MAIQKTQVDVCAEDLTPMRVLAYLSDTDKRFRLHFLTESEAAGDWMHVVRLRRSPTQRQIKTVSEE